MLRALFLVLCMASFGTLSLAQPLLYGLGRPLRSDDEHFFYRIDVDSAKLEVVGPLGYRCSGLAYDPQGALRTVCLDEEQDAWRLGLIDPQSGAVELSTTLLERNPPCCPSGFFPTGQVSIFVRDLEYRASDGALLLLVIETVFAVHPYPYYRLDVFDPGGQELLNRAYFDGVPRGWTTLPSQKVIAFVSSILSTLDLSTAGASPLGTSSLYLGIEDLAYLPASGRLLGVDQKIIQHPGAPTLRETAFSEIGQGPESESLFRVAEDIHSIVSAGPSEEELILPTLAAVGATQPSSLQTSLTFSNFSTTSGTVALEVYDSQGQQVPLEELMCQPLQGSLGEQAAVVELAAHETRRWTLTGNDFGGWARIIPSGGAPITSQAELSFLQSAAGQCPPPVESVPSGAVLTTVEVAPVRPGREFSAAGFITPTRESGFSIVNPSRLETAHVIVTANRSDGTSFDASELFLEPGQKLSLLLFELLIFNKEFLVPPERPSDFFGEVSLSSDVPIAVGGLQVLLPEGKWSNLPLTAR